MKLFTSWNTTLFAFILSCFIQACSTSNSTDAAVDRTASYPRVLEKARKDKHYLVLHSGIDTFAITSMVVEKGKKDITVHLNKIDSSARANIKSTASIAQKFTHVYMKDSTSYTLDEPHTIPLSRVARIASAN